MPGLDPQVAMHCLNINLDVKPVKQQQRQFRSEIIEAIELEVRKLIDSGFVREEQHPDWIANIVPVPKNGYIRICIDFRDLNAACLKDEFPLPITDVMIDNTCDFERMSFMDDFSGYNQIKMYPGDEKHVFQNTTRSVLLHCDAFRIEERRGNIPTGAEYNFSRGHRKTVKCYVDDIVVKSRGKGDHIADLKRIFDIMRAHQLKMNPTKSRQVPWICCNI